MAFGVVAALFSALCYGVASVLQSKAVRVDSAGPARRAPLRLVLKAGFAGGLMLDLAGFAAQFTALRIAPVFLVQAAQAASLAVTAAVAGAVLKVRLGRRDWIAVGLACAGLAALGFSAGAEGSVRTTLTFRGVLAGLGWAAGRLREPAGSAMLGLVAGLGFGVVALAARAMPSLSPLRLVADPATYALALGGVVALLFYARALQLGGVTAVTAALVTGETLLPAAVGVLVLGDHTRPGTAPIAFVGFAATLAGAAGLAHFGEVRQPAVTVEGGAGRR